MASRYMYAITTTQDKPAEDAPTHPGGWRFKVTCRLRANRDQKTLYTWRRKERHHAWVPYQTFEPNRQPTKEEARKIAIRDAVDALRTAADNIEASIENFRSGDAIDDNSYGALTAIAKIMPDGAWLRKQLNVDYLLEDPKCGKCGSDLSTDGNCSDCKPTTCAECGYEAEVDSLGLCRTCREASNEEDAFAASL